MDIRRFLLSKLKVFRAVSTRVAVGVTKQAQQVGETIRVWFIGLTLIGPGRWSRASLSIVWNQALAPRTVGDFFPVVVLVRLLRQFQISVKFTIILCPVENQKWSVLSKLQREEITRQWAAVSELILGETGAEILLREKCDSERPRKLGILSKALTDTCHSGSVFNLFAFLYKLAPTIVGPRLLCDEFKLSAEELEAVGLKTPYVTWHVRANPSYAVGRNLTDEEIVEDFLWTCANFPETQIVILSDPSGLQVVQSLISTTPQASELSQRLVLVEQTYSFALRLIWSSAFFLQRYGGGTSVGAFWSSVPYLVLMPDRWPGLPAPWAKSSQLLLETRYQRLTFAEALSRESKEMRNFKGMSKKTEY